MLRLSLTASSWLLLSALLLPLALASLPSGCSAPQSNAGNCTRDTDCKGSRICVRGDCLDVGGGDMGQVEDGGGESVDLKGIDFGGFNATCFNGKLDGFETDIDCGGGDCPKCGDSRHCFGNNDCQSGICTDNMCIPAMSMCNDGIKDGKETDIDCGGGSCPGCSVGHPCLQNLDCLSGRCAGGLCVATLPPPPSFSAAVTYSVASGAFGVTAGDVNGDGKADIITANQSANSVTLLLGRGDGSFQPMTSLSTANVPWAVVRGDFDSDGNMDIAVTLPSANSVGVFWGQGGGTFAPIVNYATGSVPRGLATADIDGDGKLDLATADDSGNDVTLLIGLMKGGGATSMKMLQVASHPRALVFADFNADGKLDIATADNFSNDISVLISSGMGNFHDYVTYRADDGPVDIAAGDFNNDGKLDIATVNATASDASLFAGKGDGTFGMPLNIVVGASPNAIAIADVNLDGKPDLAVAFPGLGELRVFIGLGGGLFEGGVQFPAGKTPNHVAFADFNRDNKPDLAAASGDSAGVLINTAQ